MTQDDKFEFNILKAETRQNRSLEDNNSYEHLTPR